MAIYSPKVEHDPFRAKKQRTIFVLIIIIALIIGGVFYYFSQKEEPLPPSYAVCDLSQLELIEKFDDYSFDDKLTVKDHFFYGENLNVFESEYKINEKNSLLGKTLILFNVCTEEEYFYLVDSDVDGQLPLDQLPNGFYEMFVNVDMIKKRVVTAEKLEDSINLVRRNEESKKVKLIADKNMFDDREHENYLNDNYLFVDISNNSKNQDYDIVLDPDYGINPSGWYDNYGPIVDNMQAADELYDMATIIKKELEKSGLKVLITRKDKNDIINLYGNGGRLNKAYDSKAKYYIHLGWGSTGLGGFKVYHSSFSSIRLAGSIANYFLQETDLTSQNESGVYAPLRYGGLDGDMTIREIGGKALSAATYSDQSKEGNSSFALNNPYGLEAIYIEHINVNNEDDVVAWKEKKEVYAKATAQALIEALNINTGDNDDISD